MAPAVARALAARIGVRAQYYAKNSSFWNVCACLFHFRVFNSKLTNPSVKRGMPLVAARVLST